VLNRRSADLLLLVTVVLWSFNFTAIKYGLTHGIAPLVYATLRFGIGTTVFTGITLVRERSLRVTRRDLLVIVVIAILSIWINQVAFVYSLEVANAATVALLFGTLPILVAVFASVAGIERLTRRHWTAVVVSFAGVVLVAVGAGASVTGDLGDTLLGVVAPATWALFTVAGGPLMTRYSPYRMSAVVGLIAIVPMALTSLGQFSRQDWGAVDPLAWAALGYSAILSFVVTNVLWFTAVDRVGATRSSLYANLQPFLGAAIAVVVLSEVLDPLEIAGGAVIAAGILIARRVRPRDEPVPPLEP
jgi:drug/metabolite transporter (DMT)-like permease